MGRGGDWPPKSFAEWMVGQNFRPKQLSPDESQKPVLRVELSEDEASGEDFLSVTYPGRRRRAGAANQAAAGASDRKVRFDGDRKPLKSALKKSSSSSSSDTTLVDTSDEESATFTDSSDIDTSEDDAPVRRRRGKSKKSKEGPCKKTKSEDSSAAKDALPHPTCTCDECVKGRKILKAVIKFEAKTKAAEETGEIQSHGKNKGQQQGRKNRSNEASDTEGDTTDADTTGDEKKPSPKGKKNKKQKQTQKASPKERTCPSPAGEPRAKAVNKSLFKLPEYPKEMKPTLIMRPEARVMQIEHALETPYDPRPNAFYDNGKGITRVYHGPRYGNPNGKLYADYDSGKVTTPRTPAGFPVGVIHNPYNPWLAPGAPGAPGPVPYLGPNPAMFAQMADSEEAMKKAADQGFGLSGLPPPSVPPYFKEMQKEAAQQVDWQKSGSGKGSKKLNSGWSPPKGGNTWQKTGSDRGSKKEDAVWGATPGWGNEDKSSNKNESGGWGGGGGADATWGAVDSGSKKGSNKDGCASPHNFGGWGDTNQPETTFQRTSKDGGSQKHGSQKNWNDGGNNNWGANDNQDCGGWGGKNTKEPAWGAMGHRNGEQKLSPNASQAPPNSKPPSTANGSPGNDGGGDWANNGNNDRGWGNGSTKAASAVEGDWGNSGNAATGWSVTSNKGDSQKQLHNDQKDTWGGPPGSFPRSAHNSRPGSNAGGNDGAWGSSGHNTRGKGSEFHHSGSKEHVKGAFDWAVGSGPPAGFNSGGPGSRRGSRSGWQDPPPANIPFEAFNGSQRSGADPPAGNYFLHSNSGPSDWTNKPSDQATGPSNPSDWRNPDAAQNTGGKAMNW